MFTPARMRKLREGFPPEKHSEKGYENVRRIAKRHLGESDSEFAEIIELMPQFFWDDEHAPCFYEAFYGAGSPPQGWKVHISMRGKDEYLNVLKKLIPALNQYGVCYKIVAPQYFHHFTPAESDVQCGKFITLYVTTREEFERFISSLSKETLELLLEDGAIAVPGELHIGGRMYARYGGFVDEYILDPDGNPVLDERGKVCPDWVNADELKNVLSSAVNK